MADDSLILQGPKDVIRAIKNSENDHQELQISRPERIDPSSQGLDAAITPEEFKLIVESITALLKFGAALATLSAVIWNTIRLTELSRSEEPPESVEAAASEQAIKVLIIRSIEGEFIDVITTHDSLEEIRDKLSRAIDVSEK